MRLSPLLLLVVSAAVLAQGDATRATSRVSKASTADFRSETSLRLLRTQSETDNAEERGFFNLKFIDDFLSKRDLAKVKAKMNSQLAANKAKEALKKEKELLNTIKKAQINGDAMYRKVFPALKEKRISKNAYMEMLEKAGRSKKDVVEGAATYMNYLTSLSSNVRVAA
jgi:vancomycin resistance protein YoaR